MPWHLPIPGATRVERAGIHSPCEFGAAGLVEPRLAPGASWKHGRSGVVVTAGATVEASGADCRDVSEISGTRRVGWALFGSGSGGVWGVEEEGCRSFCGVWRVLAARGRRRNLERWEKECCFAGQCSTRFVGGAFEPHKSGVTRRQRSMDFRFSMASGWAEGIGTSAARVFESAADWTWRMLPTRGWKATAYASSRGHPENASSCPKVLRCSGKCSWWKQTRRDQYLLEMQRFLQC